MTTLKELKGKVWYRILKVIYILCYLPYILLLFIGIYEVGREHHKPIFPDSIDETLKDPEFYKLKSYEMRDVLKTIKSNGKPWNQSIDIDDTIGNIKKQPVPTIPLKKKYIYESYHKGKICSNSWPFGRGAITDAGRRGQNGFGCRARQD